MIIFLVTLVYTGNCTPEDSNSISFHERTGDGYMDTIVPIQFPTIGDFDIKPPIINLANETCK